MATTQNTYTGNGSTTLYTFAFPYLESTDVKASVNGVVTTAFTLANNSTVSFNTPPANGSAIRIYRETASDNVQANFFAGSAIKAEDLNVNVLQSLYIAQETRNFAEATDASAVAATAATALSTAQSANTTAASASTTANGIASTANTALASANSAVATANSASATAASANSTAASATTTANNALSTANSAVSTANSALSAAQSLNPAGMVIWVAQSTAPAGFLKANGNAVSRSTYAALFAVLGTSYGAGDGSTTFNLPDLRGEFIRGLDDGRGVDSGRSLGSSQAQSYQSHNHGINDPGHGHSVNDPGHSHSVPANSGNEQNVINGCGFAYEGGAVGTSHNGTGISINGNTTGISVANSGTTETRPRNVALLACIKY